MALQSLFDALHQFRVGYDAQLHKRTLQRGLLSLIGPGCDAALAYLAAHAKPGSVSYCPHYAEGHPAETWLTLTNGVPATSIYIAVPCVQAYQNEASQ